MGLGCVRRSELQYEVECDSGEEEVGPGLITVARKEGMEVNERGRGEEFGES